jgi:hypothetical protein
VHIDFEPGKTARNQPHAPDENSFSLARGAEAWIRLDACRCCANPRSAHWSGRRPALSWGLQISQETSARKWRDFWPFRLTEKAVEVDDFESGAHVCIFVVKSSTIALKNAGNCPGDIDPGNLA